MIHRLIIIRYRILVIYLTTLYTCLFNTDYPLRYRGAIGGSNKRETRPNNTTNTKPYRKHSTYKQPRIISNIPRGTNRDRTNNNHHAHMHIMPQNHSPNNRSNKIPLPKLRRNNHMALLKMPKIRKTIPLPKMRIYWTVGDI